MKKNNNKKIKRNVLIKNISTAISITALLVVFAVVIAAEYFITKPIIMISILAVTAAIIAACAKVINFINHEFKRNHLYEYVK